MKLQHLGKPKMEPGHLNAIELDIHIPHIQVDMFEGKEPSTTLQLFLTKEKNKLFAIACLENKYLQMF